MKEHIQKVNEIVNKMLLKKNDNIISLKEFFEIMNENILLAAINLDKLSFRNKMKILEKVDKKALKENLDIDINKFQDIYEAIESKNFASIFVILNEMLYLDRITATNVLKEKNVLEELINDSLEDFAILQENKIKKDGFGYSDILTDLSIGLKYSKGKVINFWPTSFKNMISLKMLSESQKDIDFLESLNLTDNNIITLSDGFNKSELIKIISEQNLSDNEFKTKYLHGIIEVFGKDTIKEIARIKNYNFEDLNKDE